MPRQDVVPDPEPRMAAHPRARGRAVVSSPQGPEEQKSEALDPRGQHVGWPQPSDTAASGDPGDTPAPPVLL